MYKNIYFYNQGILSLMDLTTMGDSSKREDGNKIGKFDSGLKYAIAILLRNKVLFQIKSGNNIYEFDSEILKDEETGKEKEMIRVHQKNKNHNGTVIHRTSFALQLGHDWEFWMAFRELFSNCLDEKGNIFIGNITDDHSIVDSETVIEIRGNEKVQEIVDHWDSYFINDKVPLEEQYGIKIYQNKHSNYLKIYKNGILVYKDENCKSIFSYDHAHAEIDEMRVLKNLTSVEYYIDLALCYAQDIYIINKIYQCKDENIFEYRLSYCSTLSDNWLKFIQAQYAIYDEVICNPNLLYHLMNDERLDIGKRNVPTTFHQWSENKVQVEIPKIEEEVKLTFEEEVKRICKKNNFTFDYPVVPSEIKGITCLADIQRKCIYVTEDFSENHVWEMIKAVFRIKHKNDTDAIYKAYAEKIK